MPRGKKGSGPARQPEQAVAPLMGALTQKENQDENSTLLLMVLQQMEAAEQERRLEMAALQAQLQTSQEAFAKATAEWQRELAVIKRDNAAAIDAVREQFQKLIEAKPHDRTTIQNMYKAAMREAQEQIAANHAQFLEDLKTMPTGVIHNDEGQNICLIINGEARVVYADRPTTLPQIYIEEWLKRKEMKRWANELDRSMQAQRGDQSANQLALSLGNGPVWDEDRGRL